MMGNRSRRPNPQHDAAYIALRERLKAIREEAGITQVQLGQAFKRPHTFVHKVEAGDRRIDPVEFVRWCLACESDPATEVKGLARMMAKMPPPRYLDRQD